MKKVWLSILSLIFLCSSSALARNFKKEFKCYEALSLPGEPAAVGAAKVRRAGISAYYSLSPNNFLYCPVESSADCFDLPQKRRRQALRDVLEHRMEAYENYCNAQVNCVKSFLIKVQSCKGIALIERDRFEFVRSAEALVHQAATVETGSSGSSSSVR